MTDITQEDINLCKYNKICKFYDSISYVCNNPTSVRQFCGAYKSLTLHIESSPFRKEDKKLEEKIK